jgi:hypothetical protein
MSQFIFPPASLTIEYQKPDAAAALPSQLAIIGGYSGTAIKAVKVDGTGQIMVGASALPTGAATAALQTAGNNILTTIDVDTGILAAAVTASKVQTEVLSVIPGVGATNLGKAIQSAQGTTDTGVPALVVRNDTLADLSGADGDYTPLQVNATGALYVAVHSSALPTGAATSTLQTSSEAILTTINTSLDNIEADADTSAGAVKNIQSAQGTTDPGIPALVVRNDTLADLAGADHDYAPLQVNASGALYTTVSTGSIDVTSIVPGVAATSLGKAIQSAQGTTDTGVAALVVRNDTLADLAGSDHDYAPLQVNATGALYTSLATAIPAGTATIGKVDINAIAPVDFLDAGVFDSASGTNIPTGGSAVLVANLAAACTEIEVVDDIGEYMSLYTEPGGSTPGYTLKTYLPLGGGRVKVSLLSGDKIKLYSETGTTINSGKIAMNFLG